MATERIYRLTCKDCGREMLCRSPNKEFCAECIKLRRVAQSARNWQKTKAREQMRRSEEKRTQIHVANVKQTNENMIPAEYLFRCEMLLMDRLGIQYGTLTRWKAQHPEDYLEWVSGIRQLYKAVGVSGQYVLIPDEDPKYLPAKRIPSPHAWAKDRQSVPS